MNIFYFPRTQSGHLVVENSAELLTVFVTISVLPAVYAWSHS